MDLYRDFLCFEQREAERAAIDQHEKAVDHLYNRLCHALDTIAPNACDLTIQAAGGKDVVRRFISQYITEQRSQILNIDRLVRFLRELPYAPQGQ